MCDPDDSLPVFVEPLNTQKTRKNKTRIVHLAFPLSVSSVYSVVPSRCRFLTLLPNLPSTSPAHQTTRAPPASHQSRVTHYVLRITFHVSRLALRPCLTHHSSLVTLHSLFLLPNTPALHRFSTPILEHSSTPTRHCLASAAPCFCVPLPVHLPRAVKNQDRQLTPTTETLK